MVLRLRTNDRGHFVTLLSYGWLSVKLHRRRRGRQRLVIILRSRPRRRCRRRSIIGRNTTTTVVVIRWMSGVIWRRIRRRMRSSTDTVTMLMMVLVSVMVASMTMAVHTTMMMTCHCRTWGCGHMLYDSGRGLKSRWRPHFWRQSSRHVIFHNDSLN